MLLDLTAAFDTVDHNILLERLENWVGLSGMVLKWFRSYLEGRGYYVSIGEHKSKWTSMTCGVPQGSILAPLLFSLQSIDGSDMSASENQVVVIKEVVEDQGGFQAVKLHLNLCQVLDIFMREFQIKYSSTRKKLNVHKDF